MEERMEFMTPKATTPTMATQLFPLKNKPEENTEAKEFYRSILALFFETCMKFIRDQNTVEGLHELIYNFFGKEKLQLEQCIINTVYKNKKKISSVMWLTAQIEDYDMDQVILDLGSYANVLAK